MAICSLKRLLHSKADAFLSNNYYDSDIAWIELVRTLYTYVLHSCNDSSYTVYHSGTNNGNSIYSKLYFILFYFWFMLLGTGDGIELNRMNVIVCRKKLTNCTWDIVKANTDFSCLSLHFSLQTPIFMYKKLHMLNLLWDSNYQYDWEKNVRRKFNVFESLFQSNSLEF